MNFFHPVTNFLKIFDRTFFERQFIFVAKTYVFGRNLFLLQELVSVTETYSVTEIYFSERKQFLSQDLVSLTKC